MDIPTKDPNSAQGRYELLKTKRQSYLDRARESSVVTIPYIMPPEGSSGDTRYPTPYQSVGARGVNNLASKIVLALLPPNQPFFKYQLDAFKVDELTEQEGGEDLKIEFDKGLSKVESAIASEVETGGIRPSLFEAIIHLIIAGNVLLYVPTKDKARTYHLDRFCVKRTAAGDVVEIIIEDCLAPSSLTKEQQELLGEATGEEATVKLHTIVTRPNKDSKWDVWQELNGIEVPNSRGTYAKDENPYIPLRFSQVSGEDYGRGFVEQYLGDLLSVEGLRVALLEGSAASAKLIGMINPAGTTRAKRLNDARNGEFVEGNAEDVSFLRVEKQNDFGVARQTSEEIKADLASSFLQNSSVQRQGERVTAEEIRYLARELEETLGGLYSLLSQDLQLPLVQALESRLRKQKRMPPLPKKLVKPVIVTGLDALGRSHELTKLQAFTQTAQQIVGPEVFAQYADPTTLLKMIGTALSMDTDDLLKGQEQIAQEQQQAQQQAMLQSLGPNAINQAGNIAKESMSNNAEAQQSEEPPA
tara:strand:+ start:3138 stop:4727 length:1590 start_codon:yes stop_codon:yes gene_type:complete